MEKKKHFENWKKMGKNIVKKLQKLEKERIGKEKS